MMPRDRQSPEMSRGGRGQLMPGAADEGRIVEAPARTIAELIDGWQRNGSIAVIDRDAIHSHAALASESRRIAGWLAREGFRPGDRFGIWMPNVAAWLAMYLACARSGLVAVALNTRFRSSDLGDVLARSGCRGLLMWPGFAQGDYAAILEGCEPASLAALRHVVAYREGGETLPSSIAGVPVRDYVAVAAGAGSTQDRAVPGDGSLIVTTSGTTRAPKLVLHDQRTLLAHAAAVAADFGLGPDSALLLAPPLCGVFGFCNALAALVARRPLLVAPRWNAQEAADAIDRFGVTHLNATDDLIRQLLDSTARPVAFPSLRFAGFAAFNPALGDIVEQAARRGLTLVGLYGSSELQGLFSRQAQTATGPERALAGGRPVDPAVRVRVRDPLSGRLVGDGVHGELEFLAPNSRMVGYFGDAEATRDALDDEGWYRSGDLGYALGDGRFVHLSRMGDLLRLGGFLVSAAEIEAVIGQCAQVQACQVVDFAAADGTRAAAFVILRPGARFDAEAIKAHAAQRLARYKVPALVLVLEAFPVAEGGNGAKVQKAALRQLAADHGSPGAR